MGVAYRIDGASGVVFVDVQERVTGDELLAHARRVTADPKWPGRRNLHLIDIRGAARDASLTESIMREVAEIVGGLADELAHAKVALVTTDLFDVVLTYVHIFLSHVPSTIAFHELGSACGWLGIDAHYAEGVLAELRTAREPQ
jgi:hypothetical protein